MLLLCWWPFWDAVDVDDNNFFWLCQVAALSTADVEAAAAEEEEEEVVVVGEWPPTVPPPPPPNLEQAFFHLHWVHHMSLCSIPYTLRHFFASPLGLRMGDLPALAADAGEPAVDADDDDGNEDGLGLNRMYFPPPLPLIEPIVDELKAAKLATGIAMGMALAVVAVNLGLGTIWRCCGPNCTVVTL